MDKLKAIFEGIRYSGSKMTSAAKFIDHFVHDILDYTILNNDSKNFIKDLSIFDVRKAVKEILEIQ